MPTCPQCHAEYNPEDVDSQNPSCPICGEGFAKISEASPASWELKTSDSNPLDQAPHIEGFEITRHIGRGGMGDVWEARQNVLNRKVAIKVLAQNLSHSDHFLARFTREAYTLGRLQHPGIVSIYDFRSSPDGLCCIIMEYVEGPDRGDPTTLYDLIVSKELTPERTRNLVLQILHSLQYAHEEGVIHRDIKPTNVLIDRYGRVKVVDFGIAAMPADTSRKQLTYAGGPLGTAEYMAPEQTEDATQADHRADLYAVGVVVYELLTGQRPRGAFAPPSQRKPGVPTGWDAIVHKALQPDREHRYADAAEMIEAIQNLNASEPSAPMTSTDYLSLAQPTNHPVDELPFDREPEEFPGQKTSLPVHTPTSDQEPTAPLSKPSDTDLLPEEDSVDVPAWIVERQKRYQDASSETTAEPTPDSDPDHVFESSLDSGQDSALSLDKEVSTAPESSQDIPIAEVADLEAWLSSDPAPKGHDSSQMIEVAPRLPAVDEEPDSPPLPDDGTSDVIPIYDDEQSADEEFDAPLLPATEDNVAETDSDPAEEEVPAKEIPEVELPDGDFVELCIQSSDSRVNPNEEALPFRPSIRPPLIKLCVLDDGSSREGEWLRIRQSRFLIGRMEGDLVVEYDRSMSGKHAEICMNDSGDGVVDFVIRDLGSTNGTFARASRATLEDEQELLLGQRRYKILCDCQDKPGLPLYDKLVEVRKGKSGKAFRLGKPPVIIGRDPTQCNLLILDDPFLSPLHAIMKKDQKGRWAIKNYNSRNGIWIRIDEMKLVSGGEFQIGGQRLIVQIP